MIFISDPDTDVPCPMMMVNVGDKVSFKKNVEPNKRKDQTDILGAIIGDKVGSRWEFNHTNDYNFEWLSKENGFTDVLVVNSVMNANTDARVYEIQTII